MRTLLALLLRAFPAAFRDRFGDDMREQIETDHRRARTRGPLAAAWFTAATAFDLIRSAIAEHWNPTWTSVRVTHTESTMARLSDWTSDLRHAARSLRRTPGFTVVAAGTLALAIGAMSAMFAVVNAVLLKPLPFANADRLVAVTASAPGSDLPEFFGLGDEFHLQYREQSRLLENVAAYFYGTSTLRVDDRAERVQMGFGSKSLFATLGAQPILGQVPGPSDNTPAVVISYAMWSSWLGRDPKVIGRTLYASGSMRRVVAVMGPEFNFPADGTMLWIPEDVRPADIVPGRFNKSLVARVRPGVTIDALERELTALAKRLPERFGGSASYRDAIARLHTNVQTLEAQLIGGVARPLWVLLGAAAMVLIIACANVANLILVRTEGRQRDLAVRRAIGAARTRLIRSQMAEAVVIALIAGVAAAVLAAVGLPVFLRAAPPNIPRLGTVHFGLGTILFTLGAALAAALACGLAPAIRSSEPDLSRLRDGGRGATRRRHWARDGLVIGQTALALVLLIGSGLLARSFWALHHVNPGYSTDDIFTFQFAPESPDLRDGPSFARFHLAFMDRLRALPGVQTVGLVDNIPLNESTDIGEFHNDDPHTSPDAVVRLHNTVVAGDYFKAMDIPLLRGRAFATSDHSVDGRFVVVSRSAADLLWPGKDPMGRRLQLVGLDSWETVIGIVEDVMQANFRTKPDPLVYFPLVGPTPDSYRVGSPAYVVKTKRAETIAPEVRALVRQVAPTAPMYRVYTMAQLARGSMIQLSFTMLTLGIVSALALILGAVGLYGVLSYIVAQRTREIGVRMALGAEASRVRRMVVVQGARVVAVGVVIGIAVAFAATRALGSLLYDVTPLDVPTFFGMSVSMIAVGLLASYVPAHRASRVDPIESLRGD